MIQQNTKQEEGLSPVNALVKRLWHEGLKFPIVGTVFRLPETPENVEVSSFSRQLGCRECPSSP